MRQIKNVWQKFLSSERYQVISVLFLVLLSYLKVFRGFFQQDEWLSFAQRIVALSGGLLGIFKDSFTPSVGHFQPLNSLLINILFYMFRVNYFPYALISITLHLINVYLVYRLAKILLKGSRGPIIISLFFGVSAAIFQASSWVLADIGVHFSTLFAILSVHEFTIFMRSSKKLNLIKTVIYLIISLFFKEISLGLFPFYILILFFSKQNLKKYALKITTILGFYVLLRTGMFFMPVAYSKDTLATNSQTTKIIAYNLVTLPVKGLTQSLVPASFLIKEAYFIAAYIPQKVTGEPNTPAYDTFVQGEILEAITLFNFLIIIFFAIVAWRKGKNTLFSKIIFTSILFIFLNSPVFALAPEREGKMYIIDSRNLYLIGVGSSFIVYSLYTLLFQKRKKMATFLISICIISNVYGLNSALTKVVSNGVIRKNILEEITLRYPVLPKKVIFYTESDSSYYSLPEEDRILPFQSGFGQTLLVWYGRSEDFPNKFYSDRFLWEIMDQGYKEFDSRGFGYFRDFDLLSATIEEFSLPFSNIISFRYDSETGSVYDITNEVQGRLEGYFSKKKEVLNFITTSDHNPEGISFATDGKRTTYWDSKLSYNHPQFIDIDLGSTRKISNIQIDSFNNKDQNEVGYEVEVSNDGNVWEKIFYSKRYPPGEDGIVNIYLLPKLARFVKIQQVGYHKYASWVIHELKIYEVKN
ncbi:MAG: discoidin domain-containing protein [Patescibacteria group bacterium]